jgi:hypothetical protein
MYMQGIKAQFSGNPKEYHYLTVNPEKPVDVKPGDRVVVINKLKDDGVPSLSIATVTALTSEWPDGTMPVVDIINRTNLTNVTEIYRQAAAQA